MQPIAILLVVFLASIVATDINPNPHYNANDSSDWLYFSATSGYQWSGWVYRLPLENLSAPIDRLDFTINATNFITSPQYLYWSYLRTNSSSFTFQIGRASHDLTEINPEWLTFNDTAGCKYGGMYPLTWRFDIVTNTMWYQASYDMSYCSLNLNTMTFTNYGSYRSPGNGGFNGGINLYRDPPTSHNITGFVYGLDMGQLYTNSGAVLYAPLDAHFQPGKNGVLLSTAFEFPRATAVIPGTTQVVVGGAVTNGQIAVIDVPSKSQVGLFSPQPTPAAPCAAAADPLTGDIYIGAAGANGNAGGVFLLSFNVSSNESSGIYTRVVDPTSLISCMACFCYVSVVRAPPSAPTLVSLSPQNGSVSGGYPVYVWGSNFVNSSSLLCQFGHSHPQSGLLLAPALVQCTVPESPVAGSTSIRVSNDNGQTWSQQSLTFTYVDDRKRRNRQRM